MNKRDRNSAGRYTSAPTATVRERFESQYIEVPEGGCWVWTGSSKNQFGHGAFKLGARKSKVVYAHRFAWELHVGPIPHGLCVLHRCDNPLCVNPHHLFLGTSADNTADKVRKGRQLKGSQCPCAKITEATVSKIRSMADTSTAAIGAAFGISRQAVADIRFGRTWRHV